MIGLASAAALLEIEPTPIRLGPSSVRFALRINGGDLAMIRVGSEAEAVQLGDIACGIARAPRGAVRFIGRDWRTVEEDDADLLRSAIGRVFHWRVWLGYLTVLDNILLPRLHHSRVDIDDWLRQAGTLAERFGLPGLPCERPDALNEADLRRAACIRAFLGTPRLVILEHPVADESGDLFEAVVNQARAARARGAAVLWLTASRAVHRHRAVADGRRYHFVGTRMIEARS